MKTLIKLYIAVAIVFSVVEQSKAQQTKAEKETAKVTAVKQLVQSKNYVFKAQYVYPLNNTVIQLLNGQGAGNPRYLNYGYDLQVKPDSLISYLPYFGEAYFNVGYNATNDSGIKFTSTKFDYATTEKKKGNFLINIKPKDARYTNQLILTVSANGSASLSVISVNRQSITFTGYIEEPEQKKATTKS